MIFQQIGALGSLAWTAQLGQLIAWDERPVVLSFSIFDLLTEGGTYPQSIVSV